MNREVVNALSKKRLRAAIYARYSTDRQQESSIADQVAECRKFAQRNNIQVLEEHIYTDAAKSGRNRNRPALTRLLEAAERGRFDVVLVDDFSRLSRKIQHLLSVVEELSENNISVISITDGVDSSDRKMRVALMAKAFLADLIVDDVRDKTVRGLRGKVRRGFSAGDKTYGFDAVPTDEMTHDSRGALRPEGYLRVIQTEEAAVVRRIFQEFADGKSKNQIVRGLNCDGVPSGRKQKNGWAVSVVLRILGNRRYTGHFIWNQYTSKGKRRRRVENPQSEWAVYESEDLRIIPQDLWDKVQARLEETEKVFPRGTRGFQGQQGGYVHAYPKEILSGLMVCASCGSTLNKVSGKGGGYYGCLGHRRGICHVRQTLPRHQLENVILREIKAVLFNTQNLDRLFTLVEKHVKANLSGAAEAIKDKERELAKIETARRNFSRHIAEGKDYAALWEGLDLAERRMRELTAEMEGLQAPREHMFRKPPVEWVRAQAERFQELLEAKQAASALLIRNLIGIVRVELVERSAGKPFFIARSKLQPLVLLDRLPPNPNAAGPSEEGPDGSNWMTWRRVGDSNSRIS